jgi:glucose uptake protein GlcU
MFSSYTVSWIAVFIAVLLSTAADATFTQFWKKPGWTLFLLGVVLGPCSFCAFGYVGSKEGLSIASCLTNSLVVIGPILVGIIYFEEWKKLFALDYIGMAFVVVGITVLVFSKIMKGNNG